MYIYMLSVCTCAHTYIFIYTNVYSHLYSGCSRGVMFKVLDCRFVVSEFELQSRYCVQFWANILWKRLKPLILQAMG